MRRVVDPVVELMQYAARAWALEGLQDAEQSIISAAYALYGPSRGYLYLAAEAVDHYRKSKTWKDAIQKAIVERIEDGVFGTSYV